MLAELLYSLLANDAPLSVNYLNGMPWTAKFCFILLIMVLDDKSLELFISNQMGTGVDMY